MTSHVHRELIHIRSKDCDEETAGFNSHIGVSLKGPLTLRPGHEFVVSVSSAEIPFSWYNISSYLKTNQIEVDGAGSLVIDDGTYGIYDLVDAINDSSSFDFSITFNEFGSKVTLTNTTVGDKTLNFSSENSKELAKLLGFDQTDVTIAHNASVTSAGVINLLPVHSIFVHSGELSSTNVLTTENGSFADIVDKIPLVDVQPNEIIHYDPYQTAPFTSLLSNDHIQNFKIALRDQNGRLLQLNGANYEISMMFEQIPSEDQRTRRRNFNDIIQEEVPPPPPPLSMPSVHIKPPSHPETSEIMLKSNFGQERIDDMNKRKRARELTRHLNEQELDLQNAVLVSRSLI